MIFVTVGTHEQQFDRLLEYVDNLKREGIICEEVIMQTGFSTYEPKYCRWSKSLPYKEMIQNVSAARIVITHGGPASFIMPLQIGKTPIVVPRQKKFDEHVNDHQMDFAKAVAERMGTIIPVIDIKELRETVINYDCIVKSMKHGISSNNAQFNNEFEKIVESALNKKAEKEMDKIKIVFVETNCKKNGPIKQTWNIIRYIDKTKFEIALITVWPEVADNSMINDYKELDIPVYTVNMSKKKSIFCGKKAVGEILEKYRPDIVQGVGMPPYRMTLGYKNAIHFVTLRNYCYEDYPDYYGKFVGWLLAFLDIRLIKKQMKHGEPFITCSESLTKMYQKKQGVKISYIRNGVDVSKYTKKNINEMSEIRSRLELPQNKKVFIYSGGFIDRKNQIEAIEAFINMSKREEAVLLLLGDGKELDTLQNKYRIHSNIVFRGKISNMNEYLHASDIYLSTSKSEGLPNGVLEAMACGLPVLLSNIPQHLEVLEPDPECGHSYELGNVNGLAHLMDKMMGEDIIQMGEKSYNVVMGNFTAFGMSQRYQEMYLGLMEKVEQ